MKCLLGCPSSGQNVVKCLMTFCMLVPHHIQQALFTTFPSAHQTSWVLQCFPVCKYKLLVQHVWSLSLARIGHFLIWPHSGQYHPKMAARLPRRCFCVHRQNWPDVYDHHAVHWPNLGWAFWHILSLKKTQACGQNICIHQFHNPCAEFGKCAANWEKTNKHKNAATHAEHRRKKRRLLPWFVAQQHWIWLFISNVGKCAKIFRFCF